jgi:hypothetical protein
VKFLLCGLTTLFVGLKLTNHIDWEWSTVLSPIWVPSALVLILSVIVGLLGK